MVTPGKRVARAHTQSAALSGTIVPSQLLDHQPVGQAATATTISYLRLDLAATNRF